MLKNFSTRVLAIVLAVCAVSTWAAQQVISRAAGDKPVVEATSPANGASVSELSSGGYLTGKGILITFDQRIYKPMNWPSVPALLKDASGAVVKQWNNWDGDLAFGDDIGMDETSRRQMFLRANNLAAGTYTVEIAAGLFASSSDNADANTNLNDSYSFSFTYAPSGQGGDTPEVPAEDFDFVSAVPASGSVVKELKDFVFTFDTDADLNVSYTLPSGGYGTIRKNGVTIAQVPGAGNWGYTDANNNYLPAGQLRLDLMNAAISEAGEYEITIPAGVAVDDNGNSNKEFKVKYTIEGAVDPSIFTIDVTKCSPAKDATVDNLSNLSLYFTEEFYPTEKPGIAIRLMKGNDVIHTWTVADFTFDFDDFKRAPLSAIPASIADVLENGVYTIEVSDGIVSTGENGTGKLNIGAAYSFTLHKEIVEGEKQPFALNLLSPKAGDVNQESFPNIAIAPPEWGMTLSTRELTIKHGNGTEVKVPVNTMFYDLGEEGWGEKQISILINDNLKDADGNNLYGTWTLEIPEGFLSNEKYISNAASWTWTWTNPEGDKPVEYPELQVTKFGIMNSGSYKAVTNSATGGNMMFFYPEENIALDLLAWNNETQGLPTINSLNQEASIVLETNLDEWIAGAVATVSTEGVDEYGNSTTVVESTFINYVTYPGQNIPLKYHGQPTDQSNPIMHPWITCGGNANAGCWYKGKTYTLDIYLYDNVVNISKGNDLAVAHISKKFQGGTDSYVFSPVKFLGTDPDPSEGLTDKEATIAFKFSGPVEADIVWNMGMGSTGGMETWSNDDKTIWYAKIDPACWVGYDMQTGAPVDVTEVIIIVSAKDADGLVVDGPNGVKETACTMLEFELLGQEHPVTVTPAEGALESISKFNVACDDVIFAPATINEQTVLPYLTTASGVKVATVASFRQVDTKNVEMTLDKTITEPGSYVLVMPFGVFEIGEKKDEDSNAQNIAYTIEGDAVAAGATIADGAEIREIAIEGFFVNNDVTVDARSQMRLFKGDDVVARPNVQKALNNGVSMLFADFRDADGNALVLDAGADYRLMIPGTTITLTANGAKYENMEVNFKGAGAGAASVALTTAIEGHSASVAKVAKGETATVSLTPAQNWKVASLKLNGNDVLADLNGNTYTTPALNEDAEIEAEYAYDGILSTLGIDGTVADLGIRVFSEGQTINVSGVKAGQTVALYTINGMLLSQLEGVAGTPDAKFENVAAGTYIVLISENGKTTAVKIQH